MRKYLPILAALIVLAGCKKEKTAPVASPSIVGNWNVTESDLLLKPIVNDNVIIAIPLGISSFVFNKDGSAVETFNDNTTDTYNYTLSSSAGISYISFVLSGTPASNNPYYSLNQQTLIIKYHSSPNGASFSRLGPIQGITDTSKFQTVINLVR